MINMDAENLKFNQTLDFLSFCFTFKRSKLVKITVKLKKATVIIPKILSESLFTHNL